MCERSAAAFCDKCFFWIHTKKKVDKDEGELHHSTLTIDPSLDGIFVIFVVLVDRCSKQSAGDRLSHSCWFVARHQIYLPFFLELGIEFYKTERDLYRPRQRKYAGDGGGHG
jgi:hypothetical protein